MVGYQGVSARSSSQRQSGTYFTAIAHLAGALGRPVWTALKYVPDWRWLLDRADTPWYPTMRLYRQPAPGDWPGLFAEMAAALATFKGYSQ